MSNCTDLAAYRTLQELISLETWAIPYLDDQIGKCSPRLKPNPIWLGCAIRDRLLPPDLAHAKPFQWPNGPRAQIPLALVGKNDAVVSGAGSMAYCREIWCKQIEMLGFVLRKSRFPAKKTNNGRSKTPQASTESWSGGIVIAFLLAGEVSTVSDGRLVILVIPDYSKQF